MEAVAVIPGRSFNSGLFNTDNRRISHDILGRNGRIPDLGDCPFEGLIRISLDGEPDLLPFLDLPDVRLVNAALHSHLGQIIGHLKKHRRREARGDGLTDIDGAGNDDPVDTGIE